MIQENELNASSKNSEENSSDEEQDFIHFFHKNLEKEKKKEKEKEKERSRSKELDNQKNNHSNNKLNGKKIFNGKREVCKFFLKGNCKKGENCKYLHSFNPCKYFNCLKCTNKNCK